MNKLARQENIDAIVSAIGTLYSDCRVTRPSKAEIVAEAGVSHKTFYRVLTDHPEVKCHLELAEAVFDRRPAHETSISNPDPLKANPQAAISELLDTLAKLTLVIESQRKWISTLERQIGTRPASIVDTVQRGTRRRRKYKLNFS